MRGNADAQYLQKKTGLNHVTDNQINDGGTSSEINKTG